MKNDRCRICGQELFPDILLELKNMPAAAQNFPTEETLADDHGIDLELRQCSCCGVVQLTNPPVPYFRDVIRAAGCSPEMRDFPAQGKTVDTIRAKVYRFMRQQENPYSPGNICLGTCFFMGNWRVCRKSSHCRIFQSRKRSPSVGCRYVQTGKNDCRENNRASGKSAGFRSGKNSRCHYVGFI